jgi:nucleotide-binding universal stress UspA family protein
VPLDATSETESILDEVRRVAAPGAEIHLLHAVPTPTPPVGASPTVYLDLRERAAAYLRRVRQRLEGFGGGDHALLGEPTPVILSAARELRVAMIAMCTHARRGLPRWFLGSVAEGVVRRSRLPVLLARPGAPPARSDLRRILVPLDGSEHSARILETVKPLSARTGAEVALLHVESAVRDPAPQWAYHEVGPRRSAESRFERLADRLEEEGLTAYALTAHGEIPAEILNRARSIDADLIAMSTHARSGLDRAVMGSVAELVLRHADRAVLLHRPEGEALGKENGDDA